MHAECTAPVHTQTHTHTHTHACESDTIVNKRFKFAYPNDCSVREPTRKYEHLDPFRFTLLERLTCKLSKITTSQFTLAQCEVDPRAL